MQLKEANKTSASDKSNTHLEEVSGRLPANIRNLNGFASAKPSKRVESKTPDLFPPGFVAEQQQRGINKRGQTRGLESE